LRADRSANQTVPRSSTCYLCKAASCRNNVSL